MSVAACKRCNGPSSVTRDEWDRVLDTVRECYLNQGQTLPAIRQFMHEHHDFHAKERHYKTRLHQAEKAPKRLSRQQYRAMATVVGDEGSRIAHFIARRGHREVTITPQQIHKEMGRCRKKWQIADSPSSPPPLMSLSEAHHVLASSGIRLVPAEHPLLSGSPIYPTPAEMIASPASTDTSAGAVTPGVSWSSSSA